MKAFLIACAIVAGLGVTAADAQTGRGHGGNWSGGHGNWSGGHGNWSGGHGNWSGGHGGRDWHGGGRWGGWHGGHGFRGYGSIYLGWPGYWWGPSYYWPSYSYYYDYPAYGYDVYPGYDTYVERVAPAAPVQWYCPNVGYYPSVRSCPGGWVRAVPDAAPR